MNTPNKLSLTRLCIVPFMMFAYLASFIPYGKFIATFLFIFGAFTDFLDGYIARKYNMVTDLGKFLDPIADKMLVTASLILVCTDGTIPMPYSAIILAIFVGRDLAVNMLRQVASSNGTVISADKLGKYKTFSQDIALSLLMIFAGLKLIENVNATFLSVFMWVGYGFLIICTLLTIISLINYLVKNKSV